MNELNQITEYILKNSLEDFFDYLLIEYEEGLMDMYLLDRLDDREIENLFIQYYEKINDYSSKFQEVMIGFVFSHIIDWSTISKHIKSKVSDYFQI